MKPLSIGLLLVTSLAAVGLAGCQTVEEDGYSYSSGYGTSAGYGRGSTYVYERDVVVRQPTRYVYGERRWDDGPRYVREPVRPVYVAPPHRWDRPQEPRRYERPPQQSYRPVAPPQYERTTTVEQYRQAPRSSSRFGGERRGPPWDPAR